MFTNSDIKLYIERLSKTNSTPYLVSDTTLSEKPTSSTALTFTDNSQLESIIQTLKPQVKILLVTSDPFTPVVNFVLSFLSSRLSELSSGKVNSLRFTYTVKAAQDCLHLNLFIYNKAFTTTEIFVTPKKVKTTQFVIGLDDFKNSTFRFLVNVSSAILGFYRPQHLVFEEAPNFRALFKDKDQEFFRVPYSTLKSNKLVVNSYREFDRVFHYVPGGPNNTEIDKWLQVVNEYYGTDLKLITSATPERIKAHNLKAQLFKENFKYVNPFKVKKH